MDPRTRGRYLCRAITARSQIRGGRPSPERCQKVSPVILLEPITKLVTGTVARRLPLLLHKHSLLHQYQFRFVHGGSCEAPIEVANDMYEHACENREALHVAYLDATTAFGTVQHPALTAAFSAIGASQSFVRWMKFMVTGYRCILIKRMHWRTKEVRRHETDRQRRRRPGTVASGGPRGTHGQVRRGRRNGARRRATDKKRREMPWA